MAETKRLLGKMTEDKKGEEPIKVEEEDDEILENEGQDDREWLDPWPGANHVYCNQKIVHGNDRLSFYAVVSVIILFSLPFLLFM
jgi:hypothetical protein